MMTCHHTLAERETAVADGMCPICSAEAPPPIKRPVTHTYKGLLNPWLPQGHGEPCYYCGKPCSSLAGNPNEWPLPFCHADDPGVMKWHHTGCVTEMLRPTPPLPEEIAGLIERLRGWPWPDCPLPSEAVADMQKAAAALRAQAQEIARLHERLEDNHEFELKDGQMVRVEVAPGSIPDGIECRDETIKLKKERIRDLEAERDAIRAKTFEECAQVIQEDFDRPDMAEAIRALAQADEGLPTAADVRGNPQG